MSRGIKIIQTAFLPSNANAARSMNALNALICFKMPPSSLALLASDATRFNISSISDFPSSLLSVVDFPRSTASSISCTVVLRTSRCWDIRLVNEKYGKGRPLPEHHEILSRD